MYEYCLDYFEDAIFFVISKVLLERGINLKYLSLRFSWEIHCVVSYKVEFRRTYLLKI